MNFGASRTLAIFIPQLESLGIALTRLVFLMRAKILELEKILVLIFTGLSSWTGWRVLPSWALIFFQEEESALATRWWPRRVSSSCPTRDGYLHHSFGIWCHPRVFFCKNHPLGEGEILIDGRVFESIIEKSAKERCFL
jgi:hypothetical protein